MRTITKLYINPKAESIDIILHGASGGIELSFMQSLFETSIEAGNSAVMFNFPYIECDDKSQPSDKLLEELATLNEVVEFIRQFNYKHVRLIGKSLGGLVASKYVSETLDKVQPEFTYELIILGYIVSYYDFKIKGATSVKVIQGSDDDYGTPLEVKQLLADMVQGADTQVQVHDIENANHSYHTPGTKDGAQVEQVLSLI